MSFRSLDLARYDLSRVQFTTALSEATARKAISVVEEPGEKPHWRGWHSYTIQGTSYWADLHVYQRADLDEEDEEGRRYGFSITLWKGEPETPLGAKVIRRDATEMIEIVSSEDSDSYVASTAQFFFPSEEYESPLIPSAPPFDLEEETPSLPEEYRLHPIGIRYRAEEGIFDVILDTAPGPLGVTITRAVPGVLSMTAMRDSIRDLREFAELFVDTKPENGNGED